MGKLNGFSPDFSLAILQFPILPRHAEMHKSVPLSNWNEKLHTLHSTVTYTSGKMQATTGYTDTSYRRQRILTTLDVKTSW